MSCLWCLNRPHVAMFVSNLASTTVFSLSIPQPNFSVFQDSLLQTGQHCKALFLSSSRHNVLRWPLTAVKAGQTQEFKAKIMRINSSNKVVNISALLAPSFMTKDSQEVKKAVGLLITSWQNKVLWGRWSISSGPAGDLKNTMKGKYKLSEKKGRSTPTNKSI